jgi:transcriptional regulator with XRE-family HTH domain
VESIGRRIRRMRQERGLTIQELADKVSVSYAMINSLELDRHAPNLFTVMDVAKVFNVSLDVLAYGEQHRVSVRDNYR